MLVRKTNPIGIDDVVDMIQEHMDANHDFGNISWDNFHRAYKNPKSLKSGASVPEIYSSNGEYLECLPNDNVLLTSFFYSEGQRPFFGDDFEADLALIIQCSNLDELFPNIAHRPDEELIHAFVTLIKGVASVKINDVVTTIDDVYNEFDTENIKFDDMGKFFVFRINMTASYTLSCCSDC